MVVGAEKQAKWDSNDSNDSDDKRLPGGTLDWESLVLVNHETV